MLLLRTSNKAGTTLMQTAQCKMWINPVSSIQVWVAMLFFLSYTFLFQHGSSIQAINISMSAAAMFSSTTRTCQLDGLPIRRGLYTYISNAHNFLAFAKGYGLLPKMFAPSPWPSPGNEQKMWDVATSPSTDSSLAWGRKNQSRVFHVNALSVRKLEVIECRSSILQVNAGSGGWNPPPTQQRGLHALPRDKMACGATTPKAIQRKMTFNAKVVNCGVKNVSKLWRRAVEHLSVGFFSFNASQSQTLVRLLLYADLFSCEGARESHGLWPMSHQLCRNFPDTSGTKCCNAAKPSDP